MFLLLASIKKKKKKKNHNHWNCEFVKKMKVEGFGLWRQSDYMSQMTGRAANPALAFLTVCPSPGRLAGSQQYTLCSEPWKSAAIWEKNQLCIHWFISLFGPPTPHGSSGFRINIAFPLCPLFFGDHWKKSAQPSASLPKASVSFQDSLRLKNKTKHLTFCAALIILHDWDLLLL